MNPSSSIQLSTPSRGGTNFFTMVGKDLTIRLPKFHGKGSEDLDKHLFIFENIWADKKITDKDTKVAQLAITFRDCTLD
jgi:hypothetical protein